MISMLIIAFLLLTTLRKGVSLTELLEGLVYVYEDEPKQVTESEPVKSSNKSKNSRKVNQDKDKQEEPLVLDLEKDDFPDFPIDLEEGTPQPSKQKITKADTSNKEQMSEADKMLKQIFGEGSDLI